MRRAWLVALLGAGCFNPNYGNGTLHCDDGKCPSGYHCAGDDTCWKSGTDPILDMAMMVEGDGGPGSPDLAGADMIGVMRHRGEACGAFDTCDTGHCVDGYCCDAACDNTCQACNIVGSLGFCTNVGIGMSPVGSRTCIGEASSTCGRDGKCDGVGSCRKWASGTVCLAGTCNTGTGAFTNPSTCDGSGGCIDNGSGNCAPYKCQDATQCWSSCATGDNSHCSGANTCMNNSCGLLPNGRACGTNGSQCMSGNCVDGLCCDMTCTDACQACNLSGSFGACTTLPNNAMPQGTRTCNNFGQSPCGGKCNGTQSTCFYQPNTTPCGTDCSSPTQQRNSFCDGSGSCVAAAPMTCSGNLICSVNACLTACTTDTDCLPSSYGCNESGMCAPVCVFDVDTFDNGCIYSP